MGALQPWHLIVILVIVLMVFGPGKLPELGKSLGEGFRELKKATEGTDTSTTASTATAPTTASTATAAAQPTAALLVCPKCQSSVTPGTKFCGSCGTSLVAPAVSINA